MKAIVIATLSLGLSTAAHAQGLTTQTITLVPVTDFVSVPVTMADPGDQGTVWLAVVARGNPFEDPIIVDSGWTDCGGVTLSPGLQYPSRATFVAGPSTIADTTYFNVEPPPPGTEATALTLGKGYAKDTGDGYFRFYGYDPDCDDGDGPTTCTHVAFCTRKSGEW